MRKRSIAALALSLGLLFVSTPASAAPVISGAPAADDSERDTATSALTIEGEASADKVSAGALVSIAVTVTNTGDDEHRDIAVADTLCPAASLDTGESMTCATSHAVTQAELDGGVFAVDLAATSVVQGEPVVAGTILEVPLTQVAGFSVTVSSGVTSVGAVGDVIDFTVVATNRGNVTAAPTSITLEGVGELSCAPSGAVTPDASITCIFAYVTASEADVQTLATVTWSTGEESSDPLLVAFAPAPPVVPPAPPVETPPSPSVDPSTAEPTAPADPSTRPDPVEPSSPPTATAPEPESTDPETVEPSPVPSSAEPSTAAVETASASSPLPLTAVVIPIVAIGIVILLVGLWIALRVRSRER